ncbi:MAG: hypothetical protein RL021_2108 [Bacteroidota bacterium]
MRLFRPRIRFFASFFILTCSVAAAQPRSTSIGLCLRPIFPVEFLGTGEDNTSSGGVDFSLGLRSGFSGGMVVRKGLSELLSMETGINYTKRNYTYRITDTTYSFEDRFRLIGYEVPISLLAFVRLGEQVYMNASLGAGIDAYASSVATKSERSEQVAIKRRSFNPSLNANLGWEYRIPGSGTVYLGATYHRPFGDIYKNSVLYNPGSDERIFNNLLSGSYLTADLRYYFKAEQEKKKRTTKGK